MLKPTRFIGIEKDTGKVIGVVNGLWHERYTKKMVEIINPENYSNKPFIVIELPLHYDVDVKEGDILVENEGFYRNYELLKPNIL